MSEELAAPTETVQAADVSGAGESAGAPETTVEAATPTGQEGITPSEAGEGGGQSFDSPPANERIQQLIEEQRRKDLEIASLRDEFEQFRKSQQQAPPFADEQAEMQVRKNIADNIVELRKLQDRLELEGFDPQVYAEIEHREQWNREAKEALVKNAAKRDEWQQAQRQQQESVRVNVELAQARDFIAQQRGYPKELVERGTQFFDAAQRNDPVLAAKFSELVRRQGPVAAQEFAIDYVTRNMNQQFQQQTQQKETAKENMPPGKTGSDTIAAPVDRQAVRLKNMYPTMR